MRPEKANMELKVAKKNCLKHEQDVTKHCVVSFTMLLKSTMKDYTPFVRNKYIRNMRLKSSKN